MASYLFSLSTLLAAILDPDDEPGVVAQQYGVPWSIWADGRTSVVGCCAVMLGPRSSVVLSLFLSSLLFVTVSPFSSILLYLSSSLFRPVAVFHPLLTSRYVALLALACIFRLLPAFHLSLFLVSEDLLTQGPRVSRRALWWLLRWLLASFESSRESVPPEGQGTPSGTGSPPSSPLTTPSLSSSSSLFFLSPFFAAPRTANPPYAPSEGVP